MGPATADNSAVAHLRVTSDGPCSLKEPALTLRADQELQDAAYAMLNISSSASSTWYAADAALPCKRRDKELGRFYLPAAFNARAI